MRVTLIVVTFCLMQSLCAKNMLIKTAGGGDKDLAGKELDEKIQAYPEARMWGTMPVSGFFVRHVKGLQMSDIKIIVNKDDMRPLIRFDDVSDLYINNLQTNEIHNGNCILDFINVKKVNLLNIDFPETIKVPWMAFSGSESEKIAISSVSNRNLKDLIKLENTVRKGAIKY